MAKDFVKRKNYVIDKNFQFRFIATFLLYILISLLLFSGGVFIFYWISYMAGENVVSEFIVIYRQVQVMDSQGNPQMDSDNEPLTTTEPQPPINPIQLILPPILINNLIIVLIISVLGVFYSHKIAGPAYRMSTDIQRVLDGEKGVVIRLRNTDKLQKLAEQVNALIIEYDKLRK
ncbi:MAG: hypothetical protein JXJ04_21275 [Spirochaetales bacterium]|nr:hypothetical protein [Spirochaetales bacterium]